MTDLRVPEASERNIPIIDLGPYLAGEPGAKEHIASELKKSLEGIGFFFLINHGISKQFLQESFGCLRQFFALPSEEKIKLKIDKGMTGYLAPKSTLYESWEGEKNTKPDLNEAFILRREVGADAPGVRAGRRGVNKWPERLPEFREGMMKFHATMEELAKKLLPLYAATLQKDDSFFETFFEDAHFVNRNGHYPPVQAEENQFGIAPHTDHSFLTLLPVSDIPGLEVMVGGEWIPAPSIEGAILVNTGETLTRLSNGRFPATPHRVLPPQKDRYALAFFYNPNDDAVLQPLDTCVDEDRPARYQPMTFIEFLAWRQSQNYNHMKGKAQPHLA